MKIEIFKKRIQEKKRKLKAGWTMEYDSEYIHHDERYEVLDNGNRSHPYGVHCFNLYYHKLVEIEEWLRSTFNQQDYEVIGHPGFHLWFAEEKFRTLFLLKWSK